ncbi:circularly permutated Ras protein 1-like [Pristis pectinata]|uniref:circularly permutated Ras protein 1-like n=1 Tax=Pristis pectinata TaxID=685728 RepID=UPI00223D2977|nr:circularly permutated Ras protein 1-like [Pristis pectinata]
MEFASSHFYIKCPADMDQTKESSLCGICPSGSQTSDKIAVEPVLPFYDPVESCEAAPEGHQLVLCPLYDQVYEHHSGKVWPCGGGLGAEGSVYQNYSPAQTVTPSAPAYDNRLGLSPHTAYQNQAEGSSSSGENRKGPEPPSGQPVTDAPPVPPPRRSRSRTPQGTPPPLPPRPPNMKKLPDYLQVLESIPARGSGPRAALGPAPPPLASAPPLPEKSLLAPKPQELTEDVNVVLVNLGKLADIKEVEPLQGSPTYCQNCSAAMSSCSWTQEPHASMWKCEFCNKNNTLDYRSSKGTCRDDQLYIHIPNPMTSRDIDDSLVVFCVDISGSMSVTLEPATGSSFSKSLYMSRLQAVQEAVNQSLDYLLQTSPRTRVALVTFNNEVTIYGDGLGTPQSLQDFELIDQEYLKTKGAEQPLPRCISESRDALRHRVQLLQECGSTALGPAALISIAMASQKPGSKVIICTDGRANTILGNLEDIKEDKIYQCSKLFYSHLAEYAMKQGVITSVLTIEGTDCRLPELGQLADKTGGKVNITNPASLYNEFELILEDDVVATNVTITFIADAGLYFKYEDDISSKYVKQIGNVVKDMAITFEFGIKDSEREQLQKKAALPFQLQLGFTLPDGRCAYRIITQEKPTSSHSAVVKENINLSVLQVHAAQTSARLAMDGRMHDAQEAAFAQQELMVDVLSRRKDVEQEAIYEGWVQSMSPIYSGLNHLSQDKTTAQPVYEAVGTQRDRDSVIKSLTDDVANVVYRLKNAKKKMFKKPKFLVTI